MGILTATGIPGMRFADPAAASIKKTIAAKRAKQAATRIEKSIAAEVSRQLDVELELRAVTAEPGPRGKPGKAGEAGLRGASGKDGERGPKGPKGDPGKDGADGKDGAQWFEATKAPSEAVAGDWWFNPDGTIKRFKNNKWHLVTTLRGRRGPVGPTGPAGRPGRDGNRFLFGFGAPPPAKGQATDVWFDLEIGDFYLKGRNGWRPYFNVGARAYAGESAPTESPHDADEILEGDEPISDEPSEMAGDFKLGS